MALQVDACVFRPRSVSSQSCAQPLQGGFRLAELVKSLSPTSGHSWRAFTRFSLNLVDEFMAVS